MTKMRAPPLLLFLLLSAFAQGGDCECSTDEEHGEKAAARPLKIGAIFAILVSSAAGVLIPILSKWVPPLGPEKDIFFVIKAFAAGVILATGFIHILPESFERLTSSCLDDRPWRQFPFAGFIAMVSAIGTLMVDTIATSYFSRSSAGTHLITKALITKKMSFSGLRVGTHLRDIGVRTPAALETRMAKMAPTFSGRAAALSWCSSSLEHPQSPPRAMAGRRRRSRRRRMGGALILVIEREEESGARDLV